MRILTSGAVAAVLIAVLLPAPTHAAADDVYIPVSRDEETTTFDTIDIKSVYVPCPPGTKVIGAGARTRDAGGRAVLTGVEPSLLLTGVTAYARALPDLDTPWALTVTVVCGDPDVWQTVRRSAWVYDDTEQATVTCPDDKVVYSIGFKIPDPDAWQYVKSVVPFSSQESATVQAVGGFWPLESLAAYAVCGSRYLPGMTTATVPMGSPTTTGTAPGYYWDSWVFGAGVQANVEAVFVDAIGPDEPATSAKARMARLYRSQGMAAVLTDEEMTVHGLSIGSWYEAP